MTLPKQTFRKSTGGKPPRVLLSSLRAAPVPLRQLVKSIHRLPDVGVGESDNDVTLQEVDSENDCTELDKFKKSLGELLKDGFKDQTRCTFAAIGQFPDAPNPGLDLEGIGLVGLPLTVPEAQRIINVCEQAPYGKGDKTIVDTAVRRAWQMDAAKVQFRNPTWLPFLQSKILAEVSKALGVPASAVHANLYKLLLYAEGGHFERHQDTEKEQGMFGTLIVVLPSPFTGGQLSLSHGKKEMTFNTAPDSLFGTSFTCWYTEVFHKVHAVTSGYRLALSYNLIHKATTSPLPRLSVPNASMFKMREMLETWLDRVENGQTDRAPVYLAHLLDHQYSKVGLDFDLLKGRDRPKVSWLKDLAEDLGFDIYLTQFEIHTNGPGHDDGFRPRKGRRRNEESDGSEDEVRMLEISEKEYDLKSGVAPDGSELRLEELKIEDCDVIPTLNIDLLEPDEVQSEGYMGNGAGSVDHYYHRTLLFLWPKTYHLAMVLQGGGPKAAARLLDEKVRAYTTGSPESSRLRTEIGALGHVTPLQLDTVSALARTAIALSDRELFTRATANRAFVYQKITLQTWKDAIGVFGFDFIQEPLNKALRIPDPSGASSLQISERTVKGNCAVIDNLRKAFLDDQVVQSWADDSILRLRQSSEQTKIGPEASSHLAPQREVPTGTDVVRPQKRKVDEVIDLTDSPEKRRG